jgi:adenylate kinase
MIIVMGLPGAGKSTVLSAAEQKGWEILNYGTLMFEIGKKEFNINHRDEIRKLDQQKQEHLQFQVGKYLANRKERKIILDTHCTIKTPSGYLPGLPFKILSLLHVEKLVLITAPISDILKRRKTDNTRIRDLEDEAALAEHDQMNKIYLGVYSVLSGAPANIIINKDGELEKAKEELLKLLD